MKFFHAVKEILRDKGKDKLCTSLRDMGLDAQMAEQGRPEEHAVGRLSWWWTKNSMGTIEIHGGPRELTNINLPERYHFPMIFKTQINTD